MNLSSNPPNRIHALSPAHARWTGGFWAERFAVCQNSIVPRLWDKMKGTSPTHYLHNFRIAAGLEAGRHRGAPFNDGDFYKWIEAACGILEVAPDAKLEAKVEDAIAIIAQAQRADGYLHTKVIIAEKNGTPDLHVWQVPLDFELYNMGHLFTAACVHYRVTGRDNFLQIARKTADFLGETFQNSTPQMLRCSICPSHYMGLVDLFRTTGERRYLELAQRLIELRALIPDGGEDNQDRVPFLEQRAAHGHAVRANYLYAGAADVFLETGDRTFWEPLESIWADVVGRKLYLTGGCGALYDGASPDGAIEQSTISRVHQAYGRPYQLPNQTGYNETCAGIGGVLWNWRMFLASGEARFVDVLETMLYNSVLVGSTLDGAQFSYTNPLRARHPAPTELRYGGARADFVASFCCPPNLARVLAQSHGYAYAQSDDAIWANIFGSSSLETEMAGQKLNLTQQTDYPWDGAIKITLEACPDAPFALKIRLPGWAKAASLRVNGEEREEKPLPGAYFEIHRQWRTGDTLEIELSMPAQLVEAHPLVEETLGQVAIRRGPLVYCLESPDLPPNVRVGDVRLPPDARFEPVTDPDWPNIVLLEGEVLAQPASSWNGALYRDFARQRGQPFPARLTPYFAWGNRGDSEMSVWLPLSTDSSTSPETN